MGQKDSEGRVPMNWGCWWQQLDEEDNVDENVALVPFFADQFRNGPGQWAFTSSPESRADPALRRQSCCRRRRALP